MIKTQYKKVLLLSVVLILIFSSFATSLTVTKENENKINATFYFFKPDGLSIYEEKISIEDGSKIIDLLQSKDNYSSNKIILIDALGNLEGISDIISYEDLNVLLTCPSRYKSLLNQNENVLLSTGSSFFNTIISGGAGKITPIVLAPRPRVILIWRGHEENDLAVTTVGGLISNKGFIAIGSQNGLALGFIGLGITYGTPFGTVYGLTGYSLFTRVTADDIESFPPNSKPEISSPNPSNGQENMPLSLSELSFKINDDDNDLMSYTVITFPDIGSGSGSLKTNGDYSIPVSNLQESTEYNWTVSVSDGSDTTEKTYTFTTVYYAPLITNPIPHNQGFASIDLTHLQFTITDYQGDLMDYTVETSPDIGGKSEYSISDGAYTIPIYGLRKDNWYQWYINATDGVHWTRKKFSFFTGGFSDDFNDNIKDYSKWSELYNDGQWFETNQRVEFKLYEGTGGYARKEGIESKWIPVSISPDDSVRFYWDLFTEVGSTNWAGHVRFEITDETNWLRAYYARTEDDTRFMDSNDESPSIINSKKFDGYWSNEIEIFSDKYRIRMDDDNSGWIYDDLFSSSSQLKVRLYLSTSGSTPSLYLRSGFDNIYVYTKN